jgi:hypothetical protein
MATNNVTNEGTKTAHGIYIAQGTSTPVYKTLTDGQLLIGSSGNDPSAASLTAGANITITPAAGGITIAATAGAAGALTYLASGTASSSATLSFDNNLSSTYDNYLVIGENIAPATNSTILQMRVGTGGTPTYQTSSYAGNQGGCVGTVSAAGNSSGSGAIDLAYNISSFTMSNNANCSGALAVVVGNANSSAYKSLVGNFAYMQAAGSTQIAILCVSGQWQSSTVITSLRFLMASGNIATGTFKLYGIANS